MNTVRLVAFLAFSAACLTGCSDSPGLRTEPTDVSGKITLPDGSPAKNVQVQFLPTAPGPLQVGFTTTADGSFSGRMIPGKYRYHFEAAKPESAFKAIPAEYRETTDKHQIEVKPGSEVNIALGD